MQNMFTGEHQARIVIETLHAEARHHEILKLARAGQRLPKAGMIGAALGAARERLLATMSRTSQPACQPGMAC
jgi:flagellar motor component MotA